MDEALTQLRDEEEAQARARAQLHAVTDSSLTVHGTFGAMCDKKEST